MALTSYEKYQLKKIVKELRTYRGRHTELVTVYIPAGYEIHKITQHLAQEQGTATNIKSTSTRKNVIEAIDKMITHLRLYKRTPENGLAVFSGNVSEREGQTDVKVWSIEPPEPMKQRLYRCDKTFVVDPLEEMLEVKEVYGLVVMDRRDATLALLKGKTIIPLAKTHSEVPGKFKTGGQCLIGNVLITLEGGSKLPIKELEHDSRKVLCLNKEGKIIAAKKTDFFKRVVNKLLKITLTSGKSITLTPEHPLLTKNGWLPAEKLKINMLIATPQDKEVETKNQVLILKNDIFWDTINEIKEIHKEEIVYDITVPTYQNFIANGLIVHNSAKRFASNRELAAKAHYKKVADYMKDNFMTRKNLKGILVGGPGHTKNDFVEGNFITNEVKKKVITIKDLTYTDMSGIHDLVNKSQDVLANEDIVAEKKVLGEFFQLLSTKPAMVSYGEKNTRSALEAGAVKILLLSEEIGDKKIDEFERIAEQFSTDVKILSTETREGVQLKELGKVGALLRYPVQHD